MKAAHVMVVRGWWGHWVAGDVEPVTNQYSQWGREWVAQEGIDAVG